MRLPFRIDLRHIPPLAVLIAAVSIALPGVAAAQGPTGTGDVASSPLYVASAVLFAASTPDLVQNNVTSDAFTMPAEAGNSLGTALSLPVDGASTSETALDDQMLSHQRGGASGMLMIAATPELMRSNTVTLWDEIAPPSPLPVPVDAARAAQGNLTTYQRNGN